MFNMFHKVAWRWRIWHIYSNFKKFDYFFHDKESLEQMLTEHIKAKKKNSSQLGASLWLCALVKRTVNETHRDPVKYSKDSLISASRGFTMTRNSFMIKYFRDVLQKFSRVAFYYQLLKYDYQKRSLTMLMKNFTVHMKIQHNVALNT